MAFLTALLHSSFDAAVTIAIAVICAFVLGVVWLVAVVWKGFRDYKNHR